MHDSGQIGTLGGEGHWALRDTRHADSLTAPKAVRSRLRSGNALHTLPSISTLVAPVRWPSGPQSLTAVDAVLARAVEMTEPWWSNRGARVDLQVKPAMFVAVYEYRLLSALVRLFIAMAPRLRPGDVVRVAARDDGERIRVVVRCPGAPACHEYHMPCRTMSRCRASIPQLATAFAKSGGELVCGAGGSLLHISLPAERG